MSVSATQVSVTPAGIDKEPMIADVDAAVLVEDTKPFVGLVPLSEEHAKLLAGRDAEVRMLTTNLRAASLTLVYGASGVGKSSILRAGVVASLREIAEQDLNTLGTPCFAVAIVNSWAGDPFKQLADSVAEGIRKSLAVETLPALQFTGNLVETLQTWSNSYGLELLIILDQFEEFFLYHDKEDGPGTFAHEFPLAVNAPDLRVRFLLSLRDDWLYRLDRFQHSLPTLFENRLHISPLTITSAKLAIDKAIATYNDTQPATAQVEVEPKLVDEVLSQVSTENLSPGLINQGTAQAGAPMTTVAAPSSTVEGYIDAPYMQLVMARLWDEESARWLKEKVPDRTLRLATLTRLGGAQAVVEQHLDKVMRDFSKRERQIANDCFYRLVTPGGTKYALTPDELDEWTHLPAKEIKAFLEKLADSKYRVIRRVDKKVLNGSTQVAYEAHHDRLAIAMLAWRARKEQRRIDRRNRFLFFLSVMLVLGLIAFQRYLGEREAKRVKAAAEVQLAKTENDLKLAEVTSISAEQNDRIKLADLRSLIPKFTCAKGSASLAQDAGKINSTLEIDCTQYEQLKTAGNDAQLPPRIYVHIQNEEQRAAAEELKKWLQEQRYAGRKSLVPGIENVGVRNLKASQLRYFHDNTDELNWAWLIATSLRKVCVQVTPQLIKGYEDSSAIRGRHFELWITPDALNNLGCKNNNPFLQ